MADALASASADTTGAYNPWRVSGHAARQLYDAAVRDGVIVAGNEMDTWYRSFSSREGQRPPRLVLDFSVTQPPPPPPPPNNRFSVTPEEPEAEPGTFFDVAGSGFDPNYRVLLFWDDVTDLLGTVTPASDGTISYGLMIPPNAVAGFHVISAYREKRLDERYGPFLASAAIRVDRWCDAPGQTPQPNSGPSISLNPASGPFTGGNVVQVSGSAFMPGATLEMRFGGLVCNGISTFCLGTLTAATDGSFTTNITIPPLPGPETPLYVVRIPEAVDPVQIAIAKYDAKDDPPVPPEDTTPPTVSEYNSPTFGSNGNIQNVFIQGSAVDPSGVSQVSISIQYLDGNGAPLGSAVLTNCPTGGFATSATCTTTATGWPGNTSALVYFASGTDRAGNTASTPPRTISLGRLVVYGTEINQGLPGYPLVAGKSTLARVYIGSSVQGGAVTIDSAQLDISLNGSRVVWTVNAIFSRTQFTNSSQQYTENDNVNFYLPGRWFDPGAYRFTARLYTGSTLVRTIPFARLYQFSATDDLRLFIVRPDIIAYQATYNDIDLLGRQLVYRVTNCN